MPHNNPLKRERVFEFNGGTNKIQATFHTSLEDVFGSLMQDNPTAEECKAMIGEILQQWFCQDDKTYKSIMGIIEEVV